MFHLEYQSNELNFHVSLCFMENGNVFIREVQFFSNKSRMKAFREDTPFGLLYPFNNVYSRESLLIVST